MITYSKANSAGGVSTTTIINPGGTPQATIAAFTTLFHILIYDSGNPVISIGTTPGGVEIADNINVLDSFLDVAQTLYFPVSTTLYFTGLTAAGKVVTL